VEHNFNSIITKGGDEGYTFLGGCKLSKGDNLASLLGETDELQVRMGWVIFHAQRQESFIYDESDIDGYDQLGMLQDISFQSTALSEQLWKFMGELATGEEVNNNLNQLEEWCQGWMPDERINHFVIPGKQNDLIAMSAHSARTQARKVEREMVKNLQNLEIKSSLQRWMPWMNRLSDYYYLITML